MILFKRGDRLLSLLLSGPGNLNNLNLSGPIQDGRCGFFAARGALAMRAIESLL
jgi:hypothetical protein